MSRSRLPVQRTYLTWALLLVAILGARNERADAADALPSCKPVIARLVSIQGAVEIRRAGASAWQRVTRLDTTVCAGDLLHVGSRSRAALYIRPESLVRLDQNSTALLRVEGDITEIELYLDEYFPKDLVGNACGAVYNIARFPGKYRVKTRHTNATIEGTEFLVGLACSSTTVAVFEGRVQAVDLTQGASTTFSLDPNQSVTFGGAEPPAVKLIVKPIDAVQWALYYPPLGEADVSTQPAATGGGNAAIDVDAACDAAAPTARSACLLRRAEARLRVGQVDEARADIEQALVLTPDNADALALLSIISLVQNNKTQALELASRATTLNLNSFRAWLALSYAQQGAFNLEDALASARKAAQINPNSSLAQARVAELLMSLGRIREAERAAQAAVAANPNDSRAHTVLGFVRLAQINTRRAKDDFNAAIALDSSDPLPRLGLGLAIIREGNLEAGREQIEIATILDPTNSLVRSYMGKAYYEENTAKRDKLAATQYGLAKQLDPNDPTPWFYDAILKQSQNRPVEALEDLQKSIELNDNRAVYRSQLLLDEDNAARSVNLARIYGDLAFDQLAIDTSLNSLTFDPTNFSAHRFLADAYAPLVGLGQARVSELLQAQTLQPANLNAIQPQLGESNLLIAERTGPPVVGYNEFNSLFAQNGIQFLLSGVGGTQDTWGEDVLFSALYGGALASIGQFHYQTEGEAEETGLTQDIFDVFVQKDFSVDTSLQAGYRRTHTVRSDSRRPFDPVDIARDFQDDVKRKTGRLALRQALTPTSSLLISLVSQEREAQEQDFIETEVPVLPLPIIASTLVTEDSNVLSAEAQYLLRGSRFSVVAGGGYYHDSFTNTYNILAELSDGTILNEAFRVDDSANRQANLYLYSTFQLSPALLVVAGLSGDSITQGYWFEDEQLNPKLGAVWQPWKGGTLRAAWYRYLKRSLPAGATLEPTQVAGFNQLFDDPDGTDSRSYGLGVDQAFRRNLFAGGEFIKRKLTFAVPPVVGTNEPSFLENWDERIARAYISWLPDPRVSLSAEYRYALQELTDEVSNTGLSPSRIDTRLLPLTVTYHHPSGWFGLVRGTYVDQALGFFVDGQLRTEDDSFWNVDVVLGYRLPRRLGQVSVVLKNALDEDFRFEDSNFRGDPRPPLFTSGRAVFLNFTLSF